METYYCSPFVSRVYSNRIRVSIGSSGWKPTIKKSKGRRSMCSVAAPCKGGYARGAAAGEGEGGRRR
jgi:hypothetical protein